MHERLSERIIQLVGVIVRAGGFGSVTVIVEKGRVARIVWSIDERISE